MKIQLEGGQFAFIYRDRALGYCQVCEKRRPCNLCEIRVPRKTIEAVICDMCIPAFVRQLIVDGVP